MGVGPDWKTILPNPFTLQQKGSQTRVLWTRAILLHLAIHSPVYVKTLLEDRNLQITEAIHGPLLTMVLDAQIAFRISIILIVCRLNTAHPHLPLIAFAPHLALIPGPAILLTVLGLNLAGEGLRDALDPKSQKGAQQGSGRPAP